MAISRRRRWWIGIAERRRMDRSIAGRRRPRRGPRKLSPANNQPVISSVNDHSTEGKEPTASILQQAETAPGKIDKSKLTFGEPWRLRDKAHLKFVAAQPCLICGRSPADAHHLRFTRSRAMGLTAPPCRESSRRLHGSRRGRGCIEAIARLWMAPRT